MKGTQVPATRQRRREAMAAAVRPAVSIVGLIVGLSGCARTAEERQLDEMRDEIDRIQAARDRADEEVLHPEVAEETTARASPVPLPPPRTFASASGPLPPPMIASVGRGGESEGYDDGVPDPDDATPRPTIRVYGAARSGGRYLFRAADPTSSATFADGDDGSGSVSPRASALDPDAKRAYAAAFALVSARKCDKALDALAAFLLKWPDHPYADNAMYWRGECYFARGDYSRASEQFEGVVTRFPVGNKVPDALLKLGICDQKLGDPAKAKAWFDRLLQQAPQSDAAARIPPVTMPAATPRGPASEDHR